MGRLWRSLLALLAACSFEVAPTVPRDGADSDAAGDAAPDALVDAPGDALRDAPPIDAGPTDLTIAVAASADDALQDPDGSMQVAYQWVSLYGANHWGAVRFPLAGIERGAQIEAAYLDLVVDSANEDSPAVTIRAAVGASSGPLTTTLSNISTRGVGASSVTWIANNIGAGTRRTPALTGLVQQRVDEATWQPGAYVMFVFDSLPSSEGFEFHQYDHLPVGTSAAKLTVRYLNP